VLRAPLDPLPGGGFRLRLGRRERALLRSLPVQLEQLLDDAPEDPALRRLSPPAYGEEGDAEAETEYQRLVGDDLLETRRGRLRAFAGSLDEDRLTEDDLEIWLTALNDLRLVLGTRLDVREDDLVEPFDPRDPQAEGRAVYTYLSWLQEHVVAALAEARS